MFYNLGPCFRILTDFDEDSDSNSSSDMSEYGWENDENGTQNKQKPPQKQKKSKRPPSLDQYMDAMDKEIAGTDVGKSFEKETKPKAKETPKPKVCL